MAFHPFDLCETSVTDIGVNPEIPIASTSCDYAKLSTAGVNPLGLGLLGVHGALTVTSKKAALLEIIFWKFLKSFQKNIMEVGLRTSTEIGIARYKPYFFIPVQDLNVESFHEGREYKIFSN